ncbi:hypothetical protein P9112_001249 [Eukaryota sp. TZLM1-RC]
MIDFLLLWCQKDLDTVGPERVPMLEPHRFEWLGLMAQNTISVSSSGACHSVALGYWRGLGRSTLACKFPSGSLINQGFSRQSHSCCLGVRSESYMDTITIRRHGCSH